ncbi:uncharacterized protein PHACADRAFT_206568 [Phanerochaete carnosa HHB-10118-sp]|uniref:Uncharacterized protein n=1 Tax=Phanerochaete carnosa (strain HHB-10118-sp) TaxID=650164 RepID=K5WF30_PHACS|nr:uncharacterized protein PHACADRAFT_206568 [Phanerochaete carnosa HHB-10118-sp]EKM57689.1 hypothetical protein PHACADRAFT_206568 [Phanerochaete carnosa HHB-10118-sp]
MASSLLFEDVPSSVERLERTRHPQPRRVKREKTAFTKLVADVYAFVQLSIARVDTTPPHIAGYVDEQNDRLVHTPQSGQPKANLSSVLLGDGPSQFEAVIEYMALLDLPEETLACSPNAVRLGYTPEFTSVYVSRGTGSPGKWVDKKGF